MKYYIVQVDHLQDPYPDHESSYEVGIGDSYEEAVDCIMDLLKNEATPELREELTKNGKVSYAEGTMSFHIRDENWTPPVG